MRKLLVFVAVMALALPASAGAKGGIAWSGETWHIGNGVNHAGQRSCASHVSFSGGHAFLKVASKCGAAIGGSLNKTSGSWAVTFRDTKGGGKYAIGLWPANGSRPEVDFAEDKPTDSNRDLMTGTFHPKPGCTGCIHSTIKGNFTQWHTATVTRSSSGFTLYLDGREWAHYASSYHGAMHLFIHNEPWGSSGTSTLEVASVKA